MGCCSNPAFSVLIFVMIDGESSPRMVSVIAVLGVWGNGVVGRPDRRRRREHGDGIHVLSGRVHISGSAADTRMLAAPRREEKSCPALSLFLVNNSWK